MKTHISILILENEVVWKCACGNEEVVNLGWKKAEPRRRGRLLALKQIPIRLPEQFEHTDSSYDEFISAIKCNKCGVIDEDFRIEGELKCELMEIPDKLNYYKLNQWLTSPTYDQTVYEDFPHAFFRRRYKLVLES